MYMEETSWIYQACTHNVCSHKALAIKQSSNQGQDFKMKAGLANNPSYPDMVSEAMQVDLHGDK